MHVNTAPLHLRPCFSILCLVLLGGLAGGCPGGGGGSAAIAGPQSPMGEVGTTFTIGFVDGIAGLSASVTDLTDGVSEISVSGEVTDPTLRDLALLIPGSVEDGNTISGGGRARMTTKGIANVYDEGELIFIDYDAPVGTTWSLDRGSYTITRELTASSDVDDYPWGGMFIKTETVEETGRPLPGVSKLEFRTNHRFGLVGIKVDFEDSSTRETTVTASTSN